MSTAPAGNNKYHSLNTPVDSMAGSGKTAGLSFLGDSFFIGSSVLFSASSEEAAAFLSAMILRFSGCASIFETISGSLVINTSDEAVLPYLSVILKVNLL